MRGEGRRVWRCGAARRAGRPVAREPALWHVMSLDEIIVQVQCRPELWCSTHPCFKNRAVHRKIWRHISKELNLDETLLKKRWKHLKDQYRKEVKKALKAHNGVVPDDYLSCWQWYPYLSFLKEEIVATSNRNTKTLFSESESQSEEEFTDNPTKKFKQDLENASNKSLDSKKLSIIMKRMKTMNDLIENKLSSSGMEDVPRNDTDYMFLMSLLPSMKQLTELQKLHFRGKINDWLIETMSQNEYNCDNDNKFFFQGEVLPKEEGGA
ncbi:uncharacterized protein LOC128683597 [Plodia interpunctella]|uniref:uncharacterized protein LOC128683597 n=1 Tax=Plodia interpunctella TaxID=58824 RepID=UPI002367CD77|nr:uncharacterized protein LOC128683597 [Plodia interpunctella]